MKCRSLQVTEVIHQGGVLKVDLNLLDKMNIYI